MEHLIARSGSMRRRSEGYRGRQRLPQRGIEQVRPPRDHFAAPPEALLAAETKPEDLGGGEAGNGRRHCSVAKLAVADRHKGATAQPPTRPAMDKAVRRRWASQRPLPRYRHCTGSPKVQTPRLARFDACLPLPALRGETLALKAYRQLRRALEL